MLECTIEARLLGNWIIGPDVKDKDVFVIRYRDTYSKFATLLILICLRAVTETKKAKPLLSAFIETEVPRLTSRPCQRLPTIKYRELPLLLAA